MGKNQKRMAAIALCIIGIMGTIMAGKDAAARKDMETAVQSQTAQTEADVIQTTDVN